MDELGETSACGHDNFKLSFRDVNYTIRSKFPFIKSKSKIILNKISGEFHGNELTAIIGLSGSGKSSLLDFLSGFRTENIDGTIECNGKIISTRNIKEVSSYFMQEQTLHLFLTVNELMNFSINLKGRQMLNSEKNFKIKEILEKLNIFNLGNSFAMDLSGGETKRLQIALELVDDPKILFLDECTTGLDSVGSNQCIQYLKNLTKEGKTIICSIHQPSATMLRNFDHIYALAEGKCIYQGSSQNLLLFFDQVGLPCPSTYNPTDFLMEIANNDYGNHNHLLTEKIQNGMNISFRYTKNEFTNTIDIFKKSSESRKGCAASYFRQVFYLMQRAFLTVIRDKTLYSMRFGLHVALGIALGFMYKGIGNKGAFALDIYHFILLSITVVLYTSYHSLYASCKNREFISISSLKKLIFNFCFKFLVPLNFPIIKREYFNGWYTAKAYYTSLILFDAPIILICCLIYVTIAYLMTGQPLEVHRYCLFLGYSLLTAYASQALGIMLTSLMNVQVICCIILLNDLDYMH